MRTLAIAFALLVGLFVPAAAQHRGHGGMKWLDEGTIEAAKQLGGELTTWARANVLPEAQSWKVRLDGAMTPADLAKLNELRRQAAELRDRRTAAAKTVREAWRSEDYDALKSARTQMKSFSKQQEAIFQQLKPIAEANRETLEAIGEIALPKVKQWTEEARAIGERWWEANQESVSPMAAKAIGRLMSHRGDLFAMIEPKLRTKIAVARFMLWNGADFTREIDQMMQNGRLDELRELNIE